MLKWQDDQRSIWAGLERAYHAAATQECDVQGARFVVFSDHHKGGRDGADDFQTCEAIYHAALGYYHELGFTLVVLGDAEELWEVRPRTVLKAYPATLALEKQFHADRRYWRIFGNHDDEWMHTGPVRKHLDRIFEGITVQEGLRLIVHDTGTQLGEILLVHGHQGTLFSDRFRRLSRLVVRYVWRPIQRLANVKSTTPATDWVLRHKHDVTMYNWVVGREKLALIAGHTHHPVFPSRPDASRSADLASISEELANLRNTSQDLEAAGRKRAELEYEHVLTKRRRRQISWQQAQPCYFNSGCCSYGDGSITGIEIVSGEIRLVRWAEEKGQPQRYILDSQILKQVMQEVTHPDTPITVEIERGEN